MSFKCSSKSGQCPFPTILAFKGYSGSARAYLSSPRKQARPSKYTHPPKTVTESSLSRNFRTAKSSSSSATPLIHSHLALESGNPVNWVIIKSLKCSWFLTGTGQHSQCSFSCQEYFWKRTFLGEHLREGSPRCRKGAAQFAIDRFLIFLISALSFLCLFQPK